MTGVFSWEISVRLADTCHPEWGYLAPPPRVCRKLRILIFAAAIGASGSGAVLCSLAYRPVAEASVAERTLVSAENPRAGADKTTDASQAGLRSEKCSLVEPRCIEYAGALSAASGASESPRTTPAEKPAFSAAESERAIASAGETQPAAVRRAPITKTRPVVRTAPRYRLYAATRYQLRYGERERGSYGPQSGYGSYKYRDYQ